MKNISLTDARPGMILAGPVEDALGRILINAGEQLTEDLIKVLLRRGFSEIEVRPEKQPEAEEASTEAPDKDPNDTYEVALNKLTTEFKGRFSRTEDYSSCDRLLMRAALSVLVGRLNARLKPE